MALCCVAVACGDSGGGGATDADTRDHTVNVDVSDVSTDGDTGATGAGWAFEVNTGPNTTSHPTDRVVVGWLWISGNDDLPVLPLLLPSTDLDPMGTMSLAVDPAVTFATLEASPHGPLGFSAAALGAFGDSDGDGAFGANDVLLGWAKDLVLLYIGTAFDCTGGVPLPKLDGFDCKPGIQLGVVSSPQQCTEDAPGDCACTKPIIRRVGPDQATPGTTIILRDVLECAESAPNIF